MKLGNLSRYSIRWCRAAQWDGPAEAQNRARVDTEKDVSNILDTSGGFDPRGEAGRGAAWRHRMESARPSSRRTSPTPWAGTEDMPAISPLRPGAPRAPRPPFGVTLTRASSLGHPVVTPSQSRFCCVTREITSFWILSEVTGMVLTISGTGPRQT